MPADPYQVPGLPRDVVKQWIVRTLGNGRTPRRWSPETEKDKPEITAWSIAEVGKVVLAVMPFLANPTALPIRTMRQKPRIGLAHALL